MSYFENFQKAGRESMEILKMSSVMIPSIKKQIKKMGEEKMAIALSDDVKMEELSKEIYLGLPKPAKMKVREDDFIGYMISNKKKLMKSKKNKKKVQKHLNKDVSTTS